MASKFFQVGGSLSSNLPSYIERDADQKLYNHLQKGDFCYVLTARQMGKSSLKVKTMNRLGREGWITASIDLTAFGTTGFTTEQWYLSFLSEIADALDFEGVFFDWWEAHKGITPVARMSAFWEEVLLKETEQKVVILIDEVDTILSLDKHSFSTDDFFAAIRAAYNKRSKNEDFNRLNFAIFGVAAPQDLMTDHERTPFNIGFPIPLKQFSLQEASALIAGFSNTEEINKMILNRIVYWTNGQPFLTQELGQLFSGIKCSIGNVKETVDKLVENRFFTSDIFNTPHFSNIQTRILSNKDYNSRMLSICGHLMKKKQYNFKVQSLEVLYLKLSGFVSDENNKLVISNKIYKKVFNLIWLEKAIGQIDRPYALDLQRWLASDYSVDALITGAVLKEAEKWANSRDDLSKEEQEFIQEARLAEQERENKMELQALREMESVKLKRAFAGVVFAAILAIGFGFYGFYQARIATEKAIELQAAQVEITAKAKSLEEEIIAKENAQKERDKLNADPILATAKTAIKLKKIRIAQSALEREINKGNNDPRLKKMLKQLNVPIKN